MRGADLRRTFESFCNGDSNFRGEPGPRGFVRLVRAELGLSRDNYGRHRVQETVVGEGGVATPRLRPEELSLKGLAMAICGESYVEAMNPAYEDPTDSIAGENYLAAEADGAAGAITPGNSPNVSAYLGSVTGLLEAKVLEAYNEPEYISDRLVTVIPSNLRQEKLIGHGRIGNRRAIRNPGEAHARAQFKERFVTTPETENYGLAVDVTKEAVFFDQTNQILERAEAVGHELALGKEFDIIDVFVGVTNPYNYNGTSYNTYLTSGNWINDQSNPLLDHTDLNLMRELFSRMTDQETSNRVTITPDCLLVSPSKVETAHQIMRATTYQQRTNSQAEVREGPNREAGRYEILSSPYVDQRLTDSDGLALSQSNANDYWWAWQKSKAFYWCENWSVTTKKATPDNYTMLDRGLVLSVFSDYMGVAGVREPRAVVRNKN